MLQLNRIASRALEKEIKTHAGRMRKAATRAVNKTAAQSKTFASRDIRQTLNLPAKRVGNVIGIRRASKGKLTSRLQVRKRGVPAVHYRGWKAVKTFRGRRTSTGAKKTKLLKRGGGGGGVTVKFRNDKGPARFPSGFAAVMPSGHFGLFVRKGKKRKMKRGRYAGQVRQPIVEIFGPSVQNLFSERLPRYVRNGEGRLQRIYESEVAFELSK